MRILLLVPNPISLDTFFKELCKEMVQKGFSIHCACSQDLACAAGNSPPIQPANLHAISFHRGMDPLRHLSSARELRQLVRTIQPDLVHAHFSAVIFTTALARTRDWPVTLATFHGVNYPAFGGLKRFLLRTAEAWAACRMDQNWVLKQDDWVQLQMAARKAEVKLQESFGMGCDLTRFDRTAISPQARASLRCELGFQPGQAVFAFIGRFVQDKGFPLAVRAFLELSRRDTDTRFLLVGARDPQHPNGLTWEDECALKDCAQIRSVGWQADVAKYLAISHALVFPSQREGLPVSLMEALAMGVPVIASNLPANNVVVRDGIDGIVVKRPAVEEYVAIMIRLITEKRLYSSLVTNALAGRYRFDRANYVQEQIQTYEQLYSAGTTRALPAFSM